MNRLFGRADDHASVEAIAVAAGERRRPCAVSVLPVDPVAAINELGVNRAVAGDLVLFARRLLGRHVQDTQQTQMDVVVTKGRQVVELGAQGIVLAPGDLVTPTARLQDGVGVLPGAGQRGALGVTDDPPFVYVIEALDRVGAIEGVDRVPGHVECALVTALYHRLETVMHAPPPGKGHGNVVIPVDAVGGGEQEDAAIAPTEANRLIEFVGVLLVAVDKDGGAVQIPDDVVVAAAVKCEDAQVRLDPVDAVIALGVQREVAAVVVDEGAPIAVFGDAVAVVGSLVGARNIEAGDLIVSIGHAPMRPHATEVPHAVFAQPVRRTELCRRGGCACSCRGRNTPRVCPRPAP